MRFLSALATGAIFATACALAGCSSTPSASQTLPAAGALGAGPAGPIEMLKLQLDGKMPSPFSHAALKHALTLLAGHSRPHLAFRRTSSVGMWVSSLAYSYVVGLTANGRQTLTAIDVGINGCSDPYGIKVDHSGNLWVACAFNASDNNGVVQEYQPGSSTPYATYNDAGCDLPCTSFSASAQDVAFDSNGHVFASNIDSNCMPSCNNQYPVVWWPANSPSSTPTGIADPNMQFGGGFLDVDAGGNVYTTGYGCIGTLAATCSTRSQTPLGPRLRLRI